MPNWCDTTYRCVGDKKEIRALKKVLDANNKRKTSRIRNGFGKLWIGNIIDQLGYNWQDFRCRGDITDYQMDGEVLVIYQSTAWTEAEGFREVIEKKFPSVTVYYRLEEPGCEVFCTNSFEHFPDRYFLDSYDEPMYFEELSEAVKYVASLVGHDIEESVQAITEALDQYVEEHEDEDLFYSFHEFTETDE